jgi:ornithine cyclodeaminase/alanine dehydrogenase-like protein (mu-crystallin family)
MSRLPYLDGDQIESNLAWPDAIAAIGAAVEAGGVGSAPARTVISTARGELMLMPAQTQSAVGVKVLGIAPDNPAHGRPRIQGVYVLFDAETLTPLALLDGIALTTRRTPAVSAFAASALARPGSGILTVFGSGPQAEAHVHAIRSIRPISHVVVVGRDPDRTDALVRRLADTDVAASAGSPASVSGADIVVCATTARIPLFDGAALAANACVIAVGSHQPDVRELDDTVFRRAALVVVEDAATALREGGDIVMAIASGALTTERLIGLDALATLGRSDGISVFKSVGMGWQDLAIADAAYRTWARTPL